MKIKFGSNLIHNSKHTIRISYKLQRVANSRSIEEPRSKLRGMFCRAAVLRIDRKEFCLI